MSSQFCQDQEKNLYLRVNSAAFRDLNFIRDIVIAQQSIYPEHECEFFRVRKKKPNPRNLKFMEYPE